MNPDAEFQMNEFQDKECTNFRQQAPIPSFLKTHPNLCRLSVIISEYSSKPIAAANLGTSLSRVPLRFDQAVV
jgi:hypothetical protein